MVILVTYFLFCFDTFSSMARAEMISLGIACFIYTAHK